MSPITITTRTVFPLNGPPIGEVTVPEGYLQEARDTAAWTLLHLSNVSLDKGTDRRVLLHAEMALEPALDALAAVRDAEDAAPADQVAAWRKADRRRRMASGSLAAARADADALASMAAAQGARR